MTDPIFLAMFQNIALLISSVLTIDILFLEGKTRNGVLRRLLVGLIFGLVGIILMKTPWTWNDGIFFDSRSVLIVVLGYFFGLIPTLISSVILISTRLIMGGSGAITGSLVVLAMTLIGLGARYLMKKNIQATKPWQLFIMGFVSHLVMLLIMYTLPDNQGVLLVKQIAFPILTIYPIGVTGLGLIYLGRIKNFNTRQELLLKNDQLNRTEHMANAGGWEWDLEQNHMYWSEETFKMHGFEVMKEELLSTEMIERSIACYAPPDREVIMRSFKECCEKGKSYDHVVRFKPLDHDEIWVRTIGTPVYQNGKIIKANGIIQDITDQKVKEEIFMARDRLLSLPNSCMVDDLFDEFIDRIKLVTQSQHVTMMFSEGINKKMDQISFSLSEKSRKKNDEIFALYAPANWEEIYQNCARSQQPVVHNDFSWLSGSDVPRGISREILIPILRNNEVEAVFGVINKGSDYSSLDLKMFAEIADFAWDIIAQKLNAQFAEKNAHLYQQIVNTALEGICYLDAESRFIFVNKAFAKMLGYDPEELLKQEYVVFLFPEDRVEFLYRFKERKTGKNEMYIQRFQAKDGHEIWAQVSATAKKNPAGKFSGSFAMYTDITARMNDEMKLSKQEYELRESYDLLNAVLSSTNMMTVYLDLKMNFKWVNKAYAETCQLPQEVFPGKNYFALFPDAENQAIFQEVVDTGESLFINSKPFEFPNQPDRGVTYWDWSLIPTYDEQAQISGLVFTLLEVTERVKAEIEVRKSHDLLLKIMDVNPALVYVIDIETLDLLFVNQSMIQSLGEYKEKKCYQYLQGRSDLCPDCTNQYFDKQPEGKTLERDLYNSNNHRWYHVSDKVIHWLDGKLARFSTAVDITILKEAEAKLNANQKDLLAMIEEGESSRKALLSLVEDQQIAEEKIRQINQDLETRVQERTAALSVANQELEAFSYSVSHDLRTPLRALDGFSTALIEDYSDSIDQQGLHYLSRIREASTRMDQLIDDLLNLSRITRADFSREDVNLSRMAREVSDNLIIQVPQRKIKIKIQENLVANCSPKLMKIVFENLLGNAVKFTQNCPKAEIEFKRQKIDDRIVYAIKDNGAGFSMEYANKLFIPFQRLHSANEYSGTGIGLTIVNRIITRHGGEIWPESEVNKGTTFYFTLGEH